jgi:hypothetical protein
MHLQMAALPVPRLGGEGSGLRPGARPHSQDRDMPGRQHRRRPRSRHGEAEADEPAPARRHLAPHRRHGRPIRLLLRPRRVSQSPRPP